MHKEPGGDWLLTIASVQQQTTNADAYPRYDPIVSQLELTANQLEETRQSTLFNISTYFSKSDGLTQCRRLEFGNLKAIFFIFAITRSVVLVGSLPARMYRQGLLSSLRT